MMNTGDTPIRSKTICLLDWLEIRAENLCMCWRGISIIRERRSAWLKDQVRLIDSAGETEHFMPGGSQRRRSLFCPGIYRTRRAVLEQRMQRSLKRIGRTTGGEEIVRACVESFVRIRSGTLSMQWGRTPDLSGVSSRGRRSHKIHVSDAVPEMICSEVKSSYPIRRNVRDRRAA